MSTYSNLIMTDFVLPISIACIGLLTIVISLVSHKRKKNGQ